MPENTDPISQYFKTINDLGTEASREEMHDLWKRAHRGDRRAKKRIMELNLRLVIPTAKKYYRPGMELMDLIEEGNLGLLHAIDKFDPRKGYRFSTYATYWIEQHIRRAVEEHSGIIRIPPHAWESLRMWFKQWDVLSKKLGREPSLTEMSKALKWSARQIKSVMEAAEAAKGVSSLGSAIDDEDDGLTVEETIEDTQHNSPENMLSSLKMQDEFRLALNQIGEREKEILEMRYGLISNEPMTLEEIGAKMGLSRERVRQIEERAVLRLRRIAHKLGMIEINDAPLNRVTPNYHAGTVFIKRATNLLGQPVGRDPLKDFEKRKGKK